MISGQANQYEYTPATSLYFELLAKQFGKKRALEYWNRREMFTKERIVQNEWYWNQTESNRINKQLTKYLQKNLDNRFYANN